jgi:hypothetical protein
VESLLRWLLVAAAFYGVINLAGVPAAEFDPNMGKNKQIEREHFQQCRLKAYTVYLQGRGAGLSEDKAADAGKQTFFECVGWKAGV